MGVRLIAELGSARATLAWPWADESVKTCSHKREHGTHQFMRVGVLVLPEDGYHILDGDDE